jgi:hypothetical protein
MMAHDEVKSDASGSKADGKSSDSGGFRFRILTGKSKGLYDVPGRRGDAKSSVIQLTTSPISSSSSASDGPKVCLRLFCRVENTTNRIVD